MNHFEHQQSLVNTEANKLAHDRYVELVLQGVMPILEGSMTGPYTTSKTYFMSNGETIRIVSPSSLAWAYSSPIAFCPY